MKSNKVMYDIFSSYHLTHSIDLSNFFLHPPYLNLSIFSICYINFKILCYVMVRHLTFLWHIYSASYPGSHKCFYASSKIGTVHLWMPGTNICKHHSHLAIVSMIRLQEEFIIFNFSLCYWHEYCQWIYLLASGHWEQ